MTVIDRIRKSVYHTLKNYYDKKNQRENIPDGIRFGVDYDPFLEFKNCPFAMTLVFFLVFSLPILLISFFSRGFSEFYCRTIGSFLRMLLAKISGVFPFSLAETFIVMGLLLFVACLLKKLLYFVTRAPMVVRNKFDYRFTKALLCIVSVLLTLQILVFAPCSRRVPLEKQLDLSVGEINAERLFDCAVTVTDELAECLEESDIRHTPSGLSCLPYSFDTLSQKLSDIYVEAAQKYKFLSRFSSKPKILAISPIMTYTHISGVYVPYTGEANINVNYPHHTITFSSAHEMAHQRGIALEDEANFTAFMVLYEYGDSYMKYSALVSLYDYLLSALYDADPELFYAACYRADRRVLEEIFGFNSFFEPYADSAASKVMGTVNNVSIKLRGDSDGEKSYGMMVELAVAYFEKTKSV